MLASRFEVGLGSGSGSELGSPVDVVDYLWDVLGDFTAGWFWVALPVAVVCTIGFVILARARPESAILTAAIAAVPVARAGRGPLGCRGVARDAASHLRPALHRDAVRARSPVARRRRRPGRPAAGRRRRSWRSSSSRSPGDSTGRAGSTRASPNARTEAREDAAAWLAETGRADDVLLGFEPTYLDAWEEGAPFGDIFVPRADPEARPRGARGRRPAARTGCLGPGRLGRARPGSRAAHDPAALPRPGVRVTGASGRS